MFINVKNAHTVPECQEEFCVEVLEEADVESDECGKLAHWLQGGHNGDSF